MIGNTSIGAEWGGRAINRSTPLPISPSIDPMVYRQQCFEGRQQQLEETEMDIDDDDEELELELFLDWKLELDDGADRPSNPMARHFEQAAARSTFPTPRSKDLPVSKRQRYSPGSFENSMDVTIDPMRKFNESTPPNAFQRSSIEKRMILASPPPSPCLLPRSPRQSIPMLSGMSASPPTSIPPRYYTGGPVNMVDTPKTPQRTDSGLRSQATTNGPSWRHNNQQGSTPPSIFFSKTPPDLPRGGGVSPLREVIRNLGI